jgi:hypothetical protein
MSRAAFERRIELAQIVFTRTISPELAARPPKLVLSLPLSHVNI